MHLNKLFLRNFKKYRRADLEFQDGLTGIVGSNGAGKSCIVEAIAWALYGSRASTTKRDFLKNSRAGDGDSVEVKLSLGMGRQELAIYRAMKGKSLSPEAALFLDGQPIASGSREVDEKLEELLNIGYQDFMKTFYARQKDLDNLLKEGGTGKREYLLKLLGIEDIKDRSIEQIKSDRSALEERRNRLEGALSEIGDVDARIEAVWRSISTASAALSQAKEKAAGLAQAVEKSRKDLEAQAEKRRSHDLLAERASRLEASASERKLAIRADEARLAEIEGMKKLLAQIEPRLSRLELVRSTLALLEPLQRKHEELTRGLVGSRADREGVRRLLKEREDRREALQMDRAVLEEIRPLEQEYAELLKRLETLEQLKDRHSELQTRLKEEKVRHDLAGKGISRTEAAIKDLLKARSRKEEIEPLRIQFSNLRDEQALAQSQKEKKKILDDLLERKANLEARKNRLLESAGLARKEISAIGDPGAKEAELIKLESDLDKLGTELHNGLADLKGESSALQTRRKEAFGSLARVRSLGASGNCPTCERPLGEQHDLLVRKYELTASESEKGIKELEVRIKVHKDKMDGVSSARSHLKKSYDDLNAKKRKLSGLAAGLRGAEAQIAEVASEQKEIFDKIDALGTVEFDPEHFQEISAKIEKLQPLIDEYGSLAIKLEALPKGQAELEELKIEQQRLAQSLEDLDASIKSLGYDAPEHALARKRLAELKAVHNKFTSITQRMEEWPSVVEKIAALKEELGRLEKILEGLNKALEDLGFNPAEYDELLKEQRTLSKAEAEAQRIRLRLAAEPEIRRSLEEAAKALAGLGTELEEARKQIAVLGYSQDIHREAKAVLAKAEEGHEAARKEASEREVRLGVLDGELARLKAEAVRKKEHESDLAAIGRRLQVVDTTRNIINRFMDQVLIRVRNEIARTAGEILEKVSGKYSLLKIDDDFNILVEDGSDYYPISRYSGGEIDMIAVSVRVAISEYLMRFGPDGESYSFLILDEVFGSQDQEHREKMIQMLRSLEERFPQIIAISHISDVQGQFDNTLQVVEDEMGNSRVEAI